MSVGEASLSTRSFGPNRSRSSAAMRYCRDEFSWVSRWLSNVEQRALWSERVAFRDSCLALGLAMHLERENNRQRRCDEATIVDRMQHVFEGNEVAQRVTVGDLRAQWQAIHGVGGLRVGEHY